MPGQPAKTHLTGAALGLSAVNRGQVKLKQTNELFLGEAFIGTVSFSFKGVKNLDFCSLWLSSVIPDV